MGDVPPVVRYRAIDGPAYLITWSRAPDGSWSAFLAWINKSDNDYRGAQGWAPAKDIEEIPGQDYSRVPRQTRTRTGDDDRNAHANDQQRNRSLGGRRPGPADPTDPRDPDHDRRAVDRSMIEKGIRRDEPD